MLDGFPQRDLCCGFLCAQLISVYSVTIYIATATTPTASTPHPYHHGLSRLCIHPGYHTKAITLHHTRTSGYHTRHSSYFVVYLSPAFTPPVLLHLHHHRGATRTNLLHTQYPRHGEKPGINMTQATTTNYCIKNTTDVWNLTPPANINTNTSTACDISSISQMRVQ